jgi:DNA replication protein DnaC
MERMGDILARSATRHRSLRASGRMPAGTASDLPNLLNRSQGTASSVAPHPIPTTRSLRGTAASPLVVRRAAVSTSRRGKSTPASGTGSGMPETAAATSLPDVLDNDLILEFAPKAEIAGEPVPPPAPAPAPRPKSRERHVAAPIVCPTCGGAGYVRMDVPLGDPGFGKPVPCQCREREWEDRRRAELRRFSSLDPFYEKTFDTFNPKVQGVREAFESARRYATDPQGWLVLRGGYGCGKTHLAAAIANANLAAGKHVFFSIVPDLLDHLRAAFAPGSEIRYDDMFERVREAGLLVLDDLGAENGTAWATEKLFQIINYRYNFRMPTVITTNNRLLSHLDDRLASRLSDIGLVNTIVLEAQDYRKRHAPQGATRNVPNGQRGRNPSA